VGRRGDHSGGGHGNKHHGGGHHGKHHHHKHHHDYYDSHWYVSFSFGLGAYYGTRYYYPYHHYYSGHHYAFFDPAPVTYAYVPYGFYCDTTPVYIDRTVYVRDDYKTYEYEVREEVVEEEVVDAGPADGQQVLDPQPAAGSPMAEQFLREGSEAFAAKDYYGAARKFRLAALSQPGHSGALFAMAQSLMAMGEDEYAARVLRKAVIATPALLHESGDIAGVYANVDEFQRIRSDLEKRANVAPADGDARFLLGAQQYFAGDPRSRETFAALAEVLPEDIAVQHFRTAVEMRFKVMDDLPPLEDLPEVEEAK
jgi:hypothetical protein